MTTNDAQLSTLTDVASDAGIAQRLAQHFSDVLKYVPEWGWLAYDTGAWRTDRGEVFVRRYVKDLGRILAQEAAACGPDARDHAKDLNKAVDKCYSDYGFRAVSNWAAAEDGIAARPEQFDANPWVLNLQNGTIDLQTGKWQIHNPADLLRHQAGVMFDANAHADRFERFMDEVFAGDTDLIRFVQYALGYSLTGDTREQIWFLLLGAGANGKSTLLETVRYILGSYAIALNADALIRPPHGRDGSGPDPELVSLIGARFVTAVEPATGGTLDVARLKQLTGGDTISARGLYKDAVRFYPQLKLWLAANTEPVVVEHSDAMWRRIRRLPFNISFKKNPDKTLPDTLRAEASGILNWLIEGCMLWQGVGLKTCAAVKVATNDYQASQDAYYGFFHDVLIRSDRHSDAVSGKTAYQEYEDWCADESAPRLGRNQFYDLCRQHGLQVRHTRTGASLSGCILDHSCIAA